MASSGINKQELQRWARDVHKEISKEFERESRRHPIKVPIKETVARRRPVGDQRLTDRPAPPVYEPPVQTTYNGPVIIHSGSGRMQVAWNNDQVNQSQATEQVTSGYEPLAEAVADLLERSTELHLNEPDQEDVEQTARELLTEVTTEEPNRGKVRRGVNLIVSYLAKIAGGAGAGAVDQAAALAHEKSAELTSLLG